MLSQENYVHLRNACCVETQFCQDTVYQCWVNTVSHHTQEMQTLFVPHLLAVCVCT